MNIYEQQPPKSMTVKHIKNYVTYLHFDVRELTEEERKENEIPDKFVDENGIEVVREAWTSFVVAYKHKEPLSDADYPKMVATIVRSKYSADDVEAINANYSASKTAKHKQEYNEWQAWREAAKEAARDAMG